MRRKEREVVNQTDIVSIMKKCDVCSLAFFDKTYPYVIPLNFGIGDENGQIVIYFHGAGNGTKMELLRNNNNVGFEMNTSRRLIIGEKACDATMEYESVCGAGSISIVQTVEEKRKGLQQIMKQYTGKDDDAFTEKECAAVTLLKLTAHKISGKAWNANDSI